MVKDRMRAKRQLLISDLLEVTTFAGKLNPEIRKKLHLPFHLCLCLTMFPELSLWPWHCHLVLSLLGPCWDSSITMHMKWDICLWKSHWHLAIYIKYENSSECSNAELRAWLSPSITEHVTDGWKEGEKSAETSLYEISQAEFAWWRGIAGFATTMNKGQGSKPQTWVPKDPQEVIAISLHVPSN